MPLPTSDLLPRRILFVFLDGVGIGPADPERNPFAAARLPHLTALCGGARPVTDDLAGGALHGDRFHLAGIDANLDVAGLPQSGTGQTALLTGINAAECIGRHFGPWVPTGLRPLLAAESLFRASLSRGFSTAVANAYPRQAPTPEGPHPKRPGAFPFAARAAHLLDRDEAAVRRGDAVVSSITHERWRRHVDPDAPEVSPGEAGARLARISLPNDLTVFAHYDTDYVGHRGGMSGAVSALERVDAFLGALVQNLPEDTLLLVTSDHGNLEDVQAGHTRNPALFLASGAGHAVAGSRIRAITDVTPTILYLLESRSEEAEGKGERSGG